MQLSSEQFERILSALRSDGSCGTAKEKRLRPRVGLRATVAVVEHGDGPKGIRSISMIRDVSRTGIGMQHNREMTVGQRFLVQLPSSDGTLESLLCTVRRCQHVGGDTFQIGATFIRICDVGVKNSCKNPKLAPAQSKQAGSEMSSDESIRIRKAILQ